jgi:SpoVK/Ycf46/Vps4 family AAA+-type ATPase
VKSGLWLISDSEQRLALMLKQADHGPMGETLSLEVMANDREVGERTVAELRSLMDALNVYRGQILTLSPSRQGNLTLAVAALPAVRREQIVLPAGVLERIERHTLGFAERVDALRNAGRHLKRGLLLHGPPGTGKTLTAMYLSAQMPGRTVLLLTGRALGVIEQTVQFARALAPAMVVLEDVDLVAMERGPMPGNPVLFSLLNAMDGLAEDVDIIFVLTTNRADVLEPAIASRPGRIDQAIELPYPDDEGRARLIELYSDGLKLRLEQPERIVEGTRGTSAAFIRELLRRAALVAPIGEDGSIEVTDRELHWALEDLGAASGSLTHRFLGVQPAEATPPADPQHRRPPARP